MLDFPVSCSRVKKLRRFSTKFSRCASSRPQLLEALPCPGPCFCPFPHPVVHPCPRPFPHPGPQPCHCSPLHCPPLPSCHPFPPLGIGNNLSYLISKIHLIGPNQLINYNCAPFTPTAPPTSFSLTPSLS